MAKPRPDKKTEPPKPAEQRVLPMHLKLGDRLVDASGEYEVIGRPYMTNAGKDVHVRVCRADNRDVTMIRSWAAHERVSVRRAEESSPPSAESSRWMDRR
jgi:hypothetical protein